MFTVFDKYLSGHKTLEFIHNCRIFQLLFMYDPKDTVGPHPIAVL
jgi:hypothetical protein